MSDARLAIEAYLRTQGYSRVYQGYAPETAPRPYLVLQTEDASYLEDTVGSCGKNHLVRLVVWADDYQTASQWGEAIRNLLHRYQGDMEGLSVNEIAIQPEDEFDESEVQAQATAVRLYVHETIYSVWHGVPDPQQEVS